MKKILILTIVLYTSVSSFAQQLPLYSNYFFTPYMYNPALSGKSGDTELSIVHRRQWTGIQGSPETSAIGLNGGIDSEKWGYSLYAYNDQTDIVSRTAFYGNYAYHLRFSETGTISFGLGAGYLYNSIDQSAIRVKDPTDPLLYPTTDAGVLDITAGINLQISDFQLGFSAPQLFAAPVVYSENYAGGPVQYNLIRHYIVTTQYDFKFSGKKNVLSPFIMVKMADNVTPQVDAGLLFNMTDFFFVGATYRSDYAVTANAGVHITDHLMFGYAYDFSVNEFGYDLGNSHEFLMSYSFGGSKKTEKLENEIKKMKEKQRKQTDDYEEMMDEKLEEFKDEVELEQQKNNDQLKKDLESGAVVVPVVGGTQGGNQQGGQQQGGQQGFEGGQTQGGQQQSGQQGGTQPTNYPPNNTSIQGYPASSYADNVAPGSNGYYVTAGVFSSESNAQRQIAKLKRQNVSANYFKDGSNNMFYVYVMKFNSYDQAKGARSSNLNGQYNGKLWIKVVN
jgi:type IX secretion system PorP/SprF family membrane protein